MLTLYYMALEEAVQGYECAVDRVAPLEEHPHFAPLAWQVRMIAHLYRGEEHRAAVARQRRDAASVGRPDIDQHFDLSIIYEAGAYDYLGDLLALKRNLTGIEERARTSPGWRPYATLYRGSYHALRGELAEALEHYERAVALIPEPGGHSSWSHCVTHLAVALIDMGRVTRAHEVASKAMADSETYPLAPLPRSQIEATLALAEAAVGQGSEAMFRMRRAVEAMERTGTVGAALVDQYSKLAKVALLVGDRAGFENAARRIEAICMKSESSAFAAKHAGLMRLAQSPRGFATVAQAPISLVLTGDGHTTMASGIRTELELCAGPDERARRALDVLVDWAAADEGFLYVYRSNQLLFAASSSGNEPPAVVDSSVSDWLRMSAEDDQTKTELADPISTSETTRSEFELVPIVTRRDGESLLAGVGALKRRKKPLRKLPESIIGALGESLLTTGDAGGLSLG